MEKKTRNNIISGVVIAVFIIAVAIYSWNTCPYRTPKSHKPLVAKIENAELFREEAKALSLSIPLLSDSVIAVTSDSLYTTLIQLNRAWIIFVKSEDGFEEYTRDIANLNETLDELRVQYEVERTWRRLKRGVRKFQEFKHRRQPKGKNI